MTFATELIEKLECTPDALPVGWDRNIVIGRVDRLTDISPVYRNFLRRFPETILWLESPQNRDEPFRYSAFAQVWKVRFLENRPPTLKSFTLLRRFRRLMSLRLAYLEVNELADVEKTLAELSLLAEFTISTSLGILRNQWESRLGTPWDKLENRPARFCVLALGKLGGEEINFCSDVDIIFIYDGEGFCRKENTDSNVSNSEFFTRLCGDLSNRLQARDVEGFLYNVDLRLRPEGKSGPLVRSLAGMEHYYFTAGQTWERLALIKARRVAGDAELADELYEIINPFRYPRYPPPSIIEEVAGVKIRTEKEVIGVDNLAGNIKVGHGGIREIEFIAQTMQLLKGGRNPFLQSNRTLDTLSRLDRYELLKNMNRRDLEDAYRFLRLLENRIQMQEEKQTHSLPEDASALGGIAQSLGFDNIDLFMATLQSHRQKVRACYLTLFGDPSREEEIQEWILFFSGKDPSPSIQQKFSQWFPKTSKDVASRLRRFVLPSANSVVTREQILLFKDISNRFGEVLSPLARPMRVLERLSKFADKYGARKQFLKTCSQNPSFFQAIGLLFDRSEFIYRLLCDQPEILEEIFSAGLRRSKNRSMIMEEIACLPQENDQEQAHWLWMYVKAEQVRLAITEVLESIPSYRLGDLLTDLADCVLESILNRIDPEGDMAVIGMGKYGSRETTFGSDLDLILLGREGVDTGSLARKAQRFMKIAGHKKPQGETFDIDLRLRPHGNDGALVITLPGFERYHQNRAHYWEKQILTRARPVTGNEQLLAGFVSIRKALLFSQPATREEIADNWKMRDKTAVEKGTTKPPERAFKAGYGGLVDIEFLCQSFQLTCGFNDPRLQQTNTRLILEQLIKGKYIDPRDGGILLDNYGALRKIELYLRRDNNQPITILPEKPKKQATLASWLGYGSYDVFWKKHVAVMHENRDIVSRLKKEMLKLN